MENRIHGVGSAVEDEILVLPHTPTVDNKTTAEAYRREVGGPVHTALLYLHRLGWEVRLTAAIGSDNKAAFIEDQMSKEGFDTRFLVRQQEKDSGFAHIWIDQPTGDRTIASTRGTLEPLTVDDITDDFFDGVDLLHIDGSEPQAALYAAQRAREQGITVTYDAGIYKQGSEELLRVVDVVQAPLEFARVAAGIEDLQEAADYIRTFGPRIAVVTDGERGFAYSSEEGTFYQESFHVESVIDTAGAGDVFAGGLIHGILSNMSLPDAVTFASASAAMKCMSLGKQSLPTEEEVNRFIQSYSLGITS